MSTNVLDELVERCMLTTQLLTGGLAHTFEVAVLLHIPKIQSEMLQKSKAEYSKSTK